jgi:hypothetical protein
MAHIACSVLYPAPISDLGLAVGLRRCTASNTARMPTARHSAKLASCRAPGRSTRSRGCRLGAPRIEARSPAPNERLMSWTASEAFRVHHCLYSRSRPMSVSDGASSVRKITTPPRLATTASRCTNSWLPSKKGRRSEWGGKPFGQIDGEQDVMMTAFALHSCCRSRAWGQRCRSQKTGPDPRFSGGGGSVGYRAAWTSVRAKVLVDGLCICSRMGAALLNGGSSRRRPQKPGRGRRALRTFGFMSRRRRERSTARGIRRQDPVLDSKGAKTPRVEVAGLRSSGDRRSGSGAGRAALSLVDGIASSTPRSACGSRRHMYPVSYRTAILDRLGSFQ